MTKRSVLTLVLLAGCAAAAAPAAVGHLHGGGHAWHGGGGDGVAEMKATVERVLDDFHLAPATRAKVDAVFCEHHERAKALMEKLHAGEVDHDAAMREHEAIVASAREALKPLLTDEQIQTLHDALHPRK